jgi:hypothetical protein
LFAKETAAVLKAHTLRSLASVSWGWSSCEASMSSSASSPDLSLELWAAKVDVIKLSAKRAGTCDVRCLCMGWPLSDCVLKAVFQNDWKHNETVSN